MTGGAKPVCQVEMPDGPRADLAWSPSWSGSLAASGYVQVVAVEVRIEAGGRLCSSNKEHGTALLNPS